MFRKNCVFFPENFHFSTSPLPELGCYWSNRSDCTARVAMNWEKNTIFRDHPVTVIMNGWTIVKGRGHREINKSAPIGVMEV